MPPPNSVPPFAYGPPQRMPQEGQWRRNLALRRAAIGSGITTAVMLVLCLILVFAGADDPKPDMYGRVDDPPPASELFFAALALAAVYGIIPGALIGLAVHAWKVRRRSGTAAAFGAGGPYPHAASAYMPLVAPSNQVLPPPGFRGSGMPSTTGNPAYPNGPGQSSGMPMQRPAGQVPPTGGPNGPPSPPRPPLA